MTGKAYQTQKIFFALGTVCTLTVFSGGSRTALERAKVRVMEIDSKLTPHSTASQYMMSKGYAAQECRRILTQAGVSEALIVLGETVVNIGFTRRIGVQNPFGLAGENFAYIDIEDKAIVSTGLYTRGFSGCEKTDSDALAGLTLIGDNAVQLSALCNTASHLSAKDALALLNDTEVEAIFVTRSQDVLSTDGLTKRPTNRQPHTTAQKGAA